MQTAHPGEEAQAIAILIRKALEEADAAEHAAAEE